MTLDQVLCNKNTSGAKFSIAMSGDRIASIDFVTLVTRWIKQRSAVQRGGRTVVLNGACFAGEFASGNDVDFGDRQEKHVRRLNQEMSGFSLLLVDLAGQQGVVLGKLFPLLGEQLLEWRSVGRSQTPGMNLIERAFLKAFLDAAKILGHCGLFRRLDRFRRRKLFRDWQRN